MTPKQGSNNIKIMKYIITITLTLISTASFASSGSRGVIMKSHLAINALKISKVLKSWVKIK